LAAQLILEEKVKTEVKDYLEDLALRLPDSTKLEWLPEGSRLTLRVSMNVSMRLNDLTIPPIILEDHMLDNLRLTMLAFLVKEIYPKQRTSQPLDEWLVAMANEGKNFAI